MHPCQLRIHTADPQDMEKTCSLLRGPMNAYPLSRPLSELRQEAGRRLDTYFLQEKEEKTEAQDFKQLPQGHTDRKSRVSHHSKTLL